MKNKLEITKEIKIIILIVIVAFVIVLILPILRGAKDFGRFIGGALGLPSKIGSMLSGAWDGLGEALTIDVKQELLKNKDKIYAASLEYCKKNNANETNLRQLYNAYKDGLYSINQYNYLLSVLKTPKKTFWNGVGEALGNIGKGVNG